MVGGSSIPELTMRTWVGSTETIADEINNKSQGRHHAERRKVHYAFREASCLPRFSLTSVSYAITDSGLMVVDRSWNGSRHNNVPWRDVVGVSLETGCMFAYITMRSADVQLPETVVRVWRWKGQKLYHAITQKQAQAGGGQLIGRETEAIHFVPKNLLSACQCIHPSKYALTVDGFRIHRRGLWSSRLGCLYTRTETVLWRDVNDVDYRKDTIFGSLDISTRFGESVAVKLWAGEVEVLADEAVRRRRQHTVWHRPTVPVLGGVFGDP
mmetsp:Transcript_53393/g.117227  ORF Transcript_53393/g.117227 Transcript_53393/m.117227 type:complete len:269 (+) Transcript_53393:335-1141(+)